MTGTATPALFAKQNRRMVFLFFLFIGAEAEPNLGMHATGSAASATRTNQYHKKIKETSAHCKQCIRNKVPTADGTM